MSDELIKQGEAVNEPAISRKAQRGKDAARAREIVLRQLLQANMGRQFLWGLLGSCNVFSQTFDGGPSGHARMSYAEGKRTIGLALLADIIRLDPQAYLTMTVENSAVEIKEPDNG